MQITKLTLDSHILKYLADKGLNYLDRYSDAAIAGASIASLILQQDNLPINDVDIFIVDENYEKYEEMADAMHEYELMAEAAEERRYKILGVETDGIKNIIYCYSNYVDFGENLIESFDFNCVAAAVVKRRGEYYLLETDSFVRFKQSKVVEVVNFKTPLNTLVRYYKKQSELPYRFDTLSLKRLQFMCSKSYVTNYTIVNKFEEYVPQEEQVMFSVEEIEDSDDFFSLTRKNVFELNKHELSQDLDVIADIYIGGNNATKDKYKKIIDYPNVLKAFCYYGANSIKQDFSIKNIATYEAYLALIPSFIGLLNKINTIKELFDHLEEVRKLSNHSSIVKENLSMYLAYSTTGKTIEEFEKEIGMDVKLIDPVDLSDFAEADKVEELITSGRLKVEGDSMHHCVGGYADKVKNKKCRIFRLISDGTSSTLELNEKFQIVQNYGVSNSFPKHTLDELAKKLARFLIDQVESQTKVLDNPELQRECLTSF